MIFRRGQAALPWLRLVPGRALRTFLRGTAGKTPADTAVGPAPTALLAFACDLALPAAVFAEFLNVNAFEVFRNVSALKIYKLMH